MSIKLLCRIQSTVTDHPDTIDVTSSSRAIFLYFSCIFQFFALVVRNPPVDFLYGHTALDKDVVFFRTTNLEHEWFIFVNFF
mmetsp:Transcript_87249/g.137729  ORF Transcript_87249/g.137729 Transcript_87249/m.137729 type:complete len:82 (+) Transcript_87249:79-324(+)